jgi:hypothetical protein
LIIQAIRMTLHIKGLKDWIQIKNRLKWYKKCVASYYLNIFLGDEKVVLRLTHTSWRWKGGVLIDTYFLEMKNGVLIDILLGCEHVKFGLTHNSWLWTCFLYPFFVFIYFHFSSILFFFINFSFSSIIFFIHNFFHPCTHDKIFFHITKYSVPCVNRIFQKKFDPIHLLMLTLTRSPNSNPPWHYYSLLTQHCCSLCSTLLLFACLTLLLFLLLLAQCCCSSCNIKN